MLPSEKLRWPASDPPTTEATIQPHRLLIIAATARPYIGGTISFLRGLLATLDRSRFEPHLLFLEDGPLVAEFSQAFPDLPVAVIPTGPTRQVWKTARAIVALRRYIRRHEIELILSNEAKTHIFGGWAGRPECWYSHSASPRPTPIDRLMNFVPTRQAITHGTYTAAQMSLYYHRPVEIIPIGLDPGRALQDRRPELTRDYSIPLDAPLVTLVGLLMPWKGQEYFIQAAARLATEFPTARFLIVGEAPFENCRDYAADLKRLSQELGLDERLFFLGHRADSIDLMAASDIVVNASTMPEPFGMVLLEAMLAGRPVVATRAGGPLEIVVEGETGLLVAAADPAALAQAVGKLLADPARRRAMGQAGRRRLEKHFDLAESTRRLESVLEGVLK